MFIQTVNGDDLMILIMVIVKIRTANPIVVMDQNKSPTFICINNLFQSRKGSGKGYNQTRASLLRHHSAPVDLPPLWQMKRFRKVC